MVLYRGRAGYDGLSVCALLRRENCDILSRKFTEEMG